MGIFRVLDIFERYGFQVTTMPMLRLLRVIRIIERCLKQGIGLRHTGGR